MGVGRRAGEVSIRCSQPINLQLSTRIPTAELARKQLPGYEKRVRPLRDALEEGILNSIPNTELNGHKSQRLANTTNITFHGIEFEALLIWLKCNCLRCERARKGNHAIEGKYHLVRRRPNNLRNVDGELLCRLKS